MLNQDKPQITIPEHPKINLNIESKSTIDPVIKKEKDELNEMKRIRDETGFSISRLLELKKRGYKIVKE